MGTITVVLCEVTPKTTLGKQMSLLHFVIEYHQ